MTENPQSPPTNDREPCAHRLVPIALFAALATLLIATFYPSGKPADDQLSLSFSATYFWIAAQSFALTLPGLLAGMAIGSFAPRVGAYVGAGLILAIPTIFLCDVLAFNWIAERFLSGTMSRIATSLLPALSLHITPSAVIQGVALVCVVGVASVLIWRISGWIGRKWRMREDSVQPLAMTIVLSVVALLTSYSALMSLPQTTSEMARSSARHPFCAFRIVGFRGVGVPVPTAQAAVIARLRGLQSVERVHARERQQLDLDVDRDSYAVETLNPDRKKVIIVVVECLRPEVIEPSMMPNLHAFAQRSIVCENNFAAGNATCHSMFSLVTGLEAVWFRRAVAERPLFNRILHQAGYELAFFGGQTDWAEYHMEGFINSSNFESFQIEEPDVPDTDYRAVSRSVSFIDSGDSVSNAEKEGRSDGAAMLESPVAGSGDPNPRAVVCYLYATHSRFRYSAPEDRVFLPESSASVLMSREPEMRDQVYNGYKNSLRTMDRMLKPLLRDDCVVMVMGDHGEPFLDDGTAIHGTRLSKYQNMTPSIIYYPGVEPRRIEQATYHADLLPTLLSILQIPVGDDSVFDGVDLTSTESEVLDERTFATRNFIDSTSMLVGPWTTDPSEPFGYRFSFDIFDWQASYLNPIDTEGYAWEEAQDANDPGIGKDEYRRWIVDRFGETASDESRSSEELFTQFFGSPDLETRFAALKIAASVADPEDYLYDLITGATKDPESEVRDFAKDLVIRISRYRGRPQTQTP